MIETKDHAMRVQQRRFDTGKRGVAKAVRRFNKRQMPVGSFSLNNEYPADFKGCGSFKEAMDKRAEK